MAGVAPEVVDLRAALLRLGEPVRSDGDLERVGIKGGVAGIGFEDLEGTRVFGLDPVHGAGDCRRLRARDTCRREAAALRREFQARRGRRSAARKRVGAGEMAARTSAADASTTGNDFRNCLGIFTLRGLLDDRNIAAYVDYFIAAEIRGNGTGIDSRRQVD